MKKGKIFILSGPSGSGKTSLYQAALKSSRLKRNIVKTISVTTRAKRLGEKHGLDYFFVSKRMFLFKKRQGHFLETQKVFDNYYGTPRRQVIDLLRVGKNVLLCIDVEGAKIVCRKFPRAVRIFIKTSSFGILKKRLEGRGSETKKDMALRIRRAQKELREATQYKYVVINDSFAKAVRELEGILVREIQG